jgi:hypothetical protein
VQVEALGALPAFLQQLGQGGPAAWAAKEMRGGVGIRGLGLGIGLRVRVRFRNRVKG